MDDYATAIDLDKLPHAKQFALLRSCLSHEMLRILDHGLNVPHVSKLPIAEILDKILIHIKGQKNEALRRLEFISCKQEQDEKCDHFYVRLKQSICKANCQDCIDTQVKHAILVGVRDEELTQHLLRMESRVGLQQVLMVCRSRKAA